MGKEDHWKQRTTKTEAGDLRSVTGLTAERQTINRTEANSMPDTSRMSQEELDLWSDINNPNNDADMDDWADAHNPNNEDYLGEE